MVKQIYKTKTGVEIGSLYQQPQFNLAMSRDAEELQRSLLNIKREPVIKIPGKRDYSVADMAWVITLGLSVLGLTVVWWLK